MRGVAYLALLAATACGPTVVETALPAKVASRLEPPAPTPLPTPHRASRSHPRPVLRTHHMDVTAYCSTGNRTASGVWPGPGMAATLDRSIPFGTRLRVPGFGVVTVTDRVGHGSDLDLYLGSSPACARAARAWGRRHLVVEEIAA